MTQPVGRAHDGNPKAVVIPFLVLLSGGLAFAQSDSTSPSAPTAAATDKPADDKSKQAGNIQSDKSADAAHAAHSDSSYVIGSNNALAVNVWKEPDISRSVPVCSDGKISLP